MGSDRWREGGVSARVNARGFGDAAVGIANMATGNGIPHVVADCTATRTTRVRCGMRDVVKCQVSCA